MTPTLAYGVGTPEVEYKRFIHGEVAAWWISLNERIPEPEPRMAVVPDEYEARQCLKRLGLSPALIQDRITFGQTGEVTVTG